MAARVKSQGSIQDVRDQVERAAAAAFLLGDLHAGNFGATLRDDPETAAWLRHMAEATITDALADARATLKSLLRAEGAK